MKKSYAMALLALVLFLIVLQPALKLNQLRDDVVDEVLKEHAKSYW